MKPRNWLCAVSPGVLISEKVTAFCPACADAVTLIRGCNSVLYVISSPEGSPGMFLAGSDPTVSLSNLDVRIAVVLQEVNNKTDNRE